MKYLTDLPCNIVIDRISKIQCQAKQLLVWLQNRNLKNILHLISVAILSILFFKSWII